MKTGRVKSEKIIVLFLCLIMLFSLFNNGSYLSYAQGRIATATDAVEEDAQDESIEATEVPEADTTEGNVGSAIQESDAQLFDVAIAGVENSGLENLPAVTAGNDTLNVDEVVIRNQKGDQLNEEGETINDGDEITISFEWSINNGVRGEGDDNNIYSFDLSESGITLGDTNEQAFSDGDISGKWWIKDGVFYVQLDSGNDESDRNGYANLTGKILGDKGSDEKKQEKKVQVGDKSWDLTVDMTPGDLYVDMQKQATGNVTVEGGKLYQEYTVTITPKNQDMTITGLVDALGDKLTLDSTTGIKMVFSDGNSSETFNSWNEANNYFNSGYLLKEDETITITYRAEVDFDVFEDNGASYYGNTVTVSYTKEDKTTGDSSASTGTVNVTQPSVDKKGAWKEGSDPKVIEWTITITPGDLSEFGFDQNNIQSIIDTLGDYLTSTVPGWNGEINASDLVISNGGKTYTYTYTTEVDEDVLNGSFDYKLKNEVDVTININDSTIKRHGEATVGLDKDVDLMQKEYEEYDPETDEMKWKITIDIPSDAEKAGMKNVTVKDYINYPWNHQLVSKIYLGDVLIYDKNGITTKGKEYLKEVNDDTQNQWGSSLSLTFKDEYIKNVAGKSIELHFATTAMEDADSYKNDVTLTYTYGNDEDGQESDDATYTPEKIVTKSGTQTEVSVGGTRVKRNAVDYTISLNLTKIKEQMSAGQTLTFTDSLPMYMVYDGSVEADLVYQRDSSGWFAPLTFSNGPTLAVSQGEYVDGERQKVTFSLKVTQDFINFIDDPTQFDNNWASSGDVYVNITYRAKIDPSYELEFLDRGEETFVNDVAVSLDNTFIDRSKCPTVVTAGDLVYKDGEYSPNTNTISYTVYANLDKLDLSDGDFVQGTDISGSALVLDISSINVFKHVGNGDPLESSDDDWVMLSAGTDYFYTYNAKTKTTVFTLPDETAVKITYNCKINLFHGAESSSDNDRLTPDNSTNTFVLEGVVNSGTSNQKNFNMALSRASVGGYSTTGTIDLYKYWTNKNQMVALSGSVFELRKCVTKTVDGVIEVVSDGEIYKGMSRIELDENGKTQITGLEYDNVYALCEIDADEGFLLGEPYYFALYNVKSSETPKLDNDIDKIFQSGTIYYENFREGTVNISKVDKESGKPLAGASLTVADGNGKEIASWVTDGDVYEIMVSKFETNREYILTETKAPEGYLIAAPIVFKLDSQYNIYIKGADGTFTLFDSDTIVMEDAKSGTSTDTTTETETPGTSTNVTTTTSKTTNTTSAKTGDQSPLAMVIVLLLVSATGFSILAARRKKR